MLGNSSSSEHTETLEQAVRKGWSLFHWQYLPAGWTPICWEGLGRAVLQDCLSGSLQPPISPLVFTLWNRLAGTDVPSGRWRCSAKGPQERSSSKRKSVQIYSLYSLPKAGRVSVSGTSPVGAAFSPPSAPPKCHCSQKTSQRKTCQGQCGFWSFATPLAFLSHFSGKFWEPVDHRLEDVSDNYMSWVRVPSRITESGAKLRDPTLLICLKAEVPAPSSESGHVKMPPVLSHHRAGLLLRHPLLSCPGKVEWTSNKATNLQLPNGSCRKKF